jgi:hypothetical protein
MSGSQAQGQPVLGPHVQDLSRPEYDEIRDTRLFAGKRTGDGLGQSCRA